MGSKEGLERRKRRDRRRRRRKKINREGGTELDLNYREEHREGDDREGRR